MITRPDLFMLLLGLALMTLALYWHEPVAVARLCIMLGLFSFWIGTTMWVFR